MANKFECIDCKHGSFSLLFDIGYNSAIGRHVWEVQCDNCKTEYQILPDGTAQLIRRPSHDR